MRDLTKTEDMAFAIYENMNRVLTDENERVPEIDKIDLNKNGGDVTQFFTAELLAFKVQFQQLTETENSDLIEFISVLNRLAIQYIMETSKED